MKNLINLLFHYDLKIVSYISHPNF